MANTILADATQQQFHVSAQVQYAHVIAQVPKARPPHNAPTFSSTLSCTLQPTRIARLGGPFTTSESRSIGGAPAGPLLCLRICHDRPTSVLAIGMDGPQQLSHPDYALSFCPALSRISLISPPLAASLALHPHILVSAKISLTRTLTLSYCRTCMPSAVPRPLPHSILQMVFGSLCCRSH